MLTNEMASSETLLNLDFHQAPRVSSMDSGPLCCPKIIGCVRDLSESKLGTIQRFSANAAAVEATGPSNQTEVTNLLNS